MTTEQAKSKDMNRNPEGKGGFAENPQNINAGGRPKNDQRYDYWIQFFKNMKTKQFKEYTNDRPFEEMYVAELQAYHRVSESVKNVKTWQIIAERSEGKAPQAFDVTTGGASINPITALTAEELRKLAKGK